MDTQQNQQQQPQGQTWYREFSRWGKGGHFKSVFYYDPTSKKNIFLGRIFIRLDENRKAWFKAVDPDGKDIIPETRSSIDLTQYLNKNGKELAESRLAKEAQSKETPEIEESQFEETGSEEIDPDEEIDSSEEENEHQQELDEVREEKGKGKNKDKGVSR